MGEHSKDCSSLPTIPCGGFRGACSWQQQGCAGCPHHGRRHQADVSDGDQGERGHEEKAGDRGVELGAEGVVETGGVVNQLSSYTVATVARALGKPTYVMAESFKFVREYPLGQEDLPAEYLHHASVLAKKGDCLPAPRVDYTPPSLITLLFTDLGILTPSAVSDELINLYL